MDEIDKIELHVVLMNVFLVGLFAESLLTDHALALILLQMRRSNTQKPLRKVTIGGIPFLLGGVGTIFMGERDHNKKHCHEIIIINVCLIVLARA